MLEPLEDRVLLDAGGLDDDAVLGGPPAQQEAPEFPKGDLAHLEHIPTAAFTAWIPPGRTRFEFAQEILENRRNAPPAANTPTAFAPRGLEPANVAALIVDDEFEDNDNRAQANEVQLGFASNEDVAVDVIGTLEATPAPMPFTPGEDDGAIPIANATGLETGESIIASGTIGDGPFGTTTGDYDWYAITDVVAGQLITVDVDADSQGSTLDSAVAIYNGAGEVLTTNDDEGFFQFDSKLSFTAPADDDYFVVVLGSGNFGFDLQTDPQSSGSGVTNPSSTTGDYDVTIGLDAADLDFYEVVLEEGDILGVNVNGTAESLSLQDVDGVELIGATFDASTGIYPASSPLPGGGTASLSYVTIEAGTYFVRVAGSEGDYELNLRLFRPVLEDNPIGTHQILFLDFDGETVDASQLDGFGQRFLSPLSTFLPDWGLTAADEDAVIDAIIASVAENIDTDIGSMGLNGDFDDTGVRGHFDIEILNSRDHADPFGQLNVSRVVIGGTQAELGVPTVGIAQSVDVGNFDTAETAVVLLDLLSAPATDPVSLNQYEIDPSSSMIELIGVGVGGIAAHEAGHFFSAWHTERDNDVFNIMDSGGEIDKVTGVGVDRIFGTQDDVDIDLGVDIYSIQEGFTGEEDTLNALAFALSSGKIDVSTVGLLRGTKFRDIDSDGIRDADEPGVGGFTIFADANGNGVLDDGEASTVTSGNGDYQLIVEPGTYDVTEVLRPAWVQTAPASGTYTVTVGVGEAAFDLDFGNFFDGLIVTGTTTDGNALRDEILGEGVTRSGDATFVGSGVSAGFFTGGSSSIGIDSGIVLTTGDARFTQGPNVDDGSSGTASGSGDADLDAEFSTTTLDTTLLEFDFEIAGGDLFFDFVFSSEEYNEFANSEFNDVFAFFLDGENIGFIPGTTDPISINTINGGNPFGTDPVNGDLYNNNDPDDNGLFIEAFGHDGYTDVFTATKVDLEAGVHTIKLAISDVGDSILDAAVFIRAGSFASIPGDGFVEGAIWRDDNGDGVRDEEEPAAEGLRVFLDIDGDGFHSIFEPATFTDENGMYSFEVPVGTYTVLLAETPGYDQQFPAGNGGYAIEVEADQTVAGNDFGAEPIFDYGDAADSYKTLAASGGPVHGIVPGFQLGATVDGETDGQPVDVTPLGDGADEDGVIFLSGLMPGSTAEVLVSVSQGGYSPGLLQGWIDFNADGDFYDAGEQILRDVAVVDGPNSLFFDVPSTAAFDPADPTPTAARFRLGYERGIGPDGPALAGEVEDYTDITLPQPPDTGLTARDDFFPVDPLMPILEDSADHVFDLLANDVNNAGGPLTITTAGPGSDGGTIEVALDGQTVTYTPLGDFFGTETFPYSVTNGDVTDTALVTVMVTGVNDPPNARDDNFNVDIDSSNQILLVLDNDTDPEDDTFTITGVGTPNNGGMVTPSADNLSLIYTPMAGFNGVETFTYVIDDGNMGTDTATVRVQVGPIIPADPIADFTLVTTNLAGDTITTVAQGETFLLKGLIQDVSAVPAGIFSAYLDVLYDSGFVSVVGREKQVVTLVGNPIGGSFTLTFDGETTAPIDLGADTTAADVLAALEALPNIPVDSLDVVQRLNDLDELTWEVQFGGSFAGAGVADMTADGSGLTGGTSPDAIVTVANGVDTTDPAALLGAFTFGDKYQKNRSVDDDASGCSDPSRSCFNELGAVDGSDPLGAFQLELFTVYMQADAAGVVTFEGEMADLLPLHEVSEFNSNEPVEPNQIQFNMPSLTITGAATATSPAPTPSPVGSQQFWNAENPYDVNDDGFVSPIDALIVINDLNRSGARRLTTTDVAAFSTGRDMHYMDVNRDGYLSSIDALMVINSLDRQAAPAAAAVHVAPAAPAAVSAVPAIPAAPAPAAGEETTPVTSAASPTAAPAFAAARWQAPAMAALVPGDAALETIQGNETNRTDGPAAPATAPTSLAPSTGGLAATLDEIAADVAFAWQSPIGGDAVGDEPGSALEQGGR